MIEILLEKHVKHVLKMFEINVSEMNSVEIESIMKKLKNAMIEYSIDKKIIVN
jgi:hypothetical protein